MGAGAFTPKMLFTSLACFGSVCACTGSDPNSPADGTGGSVAGGGAGGNSSPAVAGKAAGGAGKPGSAGAAGAAGAASAFVWTPEIVGPRTTGIWGASPQDIYAVTSHSVFHGSGKSWHEVKLEPSSEVGSEAIGVWGNNATEVFLVWTNGASSNRAETTCGRSPRSNRTRVSRRTGV